MGPMLESSEAAKRLGIKLPTLYAYVSRGLVASHASPDGRRSLFDIDDIEKLARRARGSRQAVSRLATVMTGVTQLKDENSAYRGSSVVELAQSWAFEDVAGLLWGVDEAEPDWSPPELPPFPDLDTSGRLRWAVLIAAAADPLRADLRPATVVRSASQLIAAMTAAVPSAPIAAGSSHGNKRLDGSIASRLTEALAPVPTAEIADAVNAALVLLADHELATSTVAVRVAASTRADLYESMLAGLGTLSGPLHGGGSQLSYDLLRDAQARGVELAVDDCLRWHGKVDGFEHTVCKTGDARVPVLLAHFDRIASDEKRKVLHDMLKLAREQRLPQPNVEIALAGIAWASGMARCAARTIYTVARVAGWTAHYLEELEERPLRYRARAFYVQTYEKPELLRPVAAHPASG